MADPGIGPLVRSYLHYGNMATSLYKQYGAAKKVKDDYEKEIRGRLRDSGMERATIQIGGGNLKVADKNEPNQLSLTKIEDLLHGYFRQRGGRDETPEIMTYIRANRGSTHHKYLKQTGLQPAGGAVPPQLQ
jgi:hypothetical protein